MGTCTNFTVQMVARINKTVLVFEKEIVSMEEGKQRGSAWSIKLAFFLYKIFGYRFLYLLLYPITFFYFLVANNAKDALRIYYSRLGIPFTNKIYYEHLRVFAICLTDRFISKMNPEDYEFIYENIEIPKKVLEYGSILVYSHFGGWAASSNGSHVSNKINVVMREVMLSGITQIENKLKPKSEINIIDLDQGTIAVSVQVANALLNEEVVAMMADRAANQKAKQEVLFLNEKANFNRNPFQIAYKMNKPIVAYFIIWVGMQRYKVEYIHIDMDRNISEKDAIEKALTVYVEKFEEIVKKHPEQWFNLFNFWEK
ncbi:MAG: lysophospholipid acyltransferase family protein [Campylobacterota bacterium]